jgi:Mitochondrial protein Pet127.
MPVTEFDFAALKPYVTSSEDVTAREMTEKHEKKYYGSSSSMTSVLTHFHYLLSAWRPVDTKRISRGFDDPLRTFTRLLRAPTAMFLRYKEKEDIYAIDADKEYDYANILMNLGKSMEKQLTMPKEQFERYRRSDPNKITAEEEAATPESYHYSTAGKFLMRSQLDAYDPRLPGTGMFDLKTRAVVSIRMEATEHERGMGYEIRRSHGKWESFEREYFDMIRAAFLKYSLQVTATAVITGTMPIQTINTAPELHSCSKIYVDASAA